MHFVDRFVQLVELGGVEELDGEKMTDHSDCFVCFAVLFQ
jgi:hypothetical protein